MANERRRTVPDVPRLLVAEFAGPEPAIAAAERLRALGYVELDAYTPFPVPDLERALRVSRPLLPIVVLGAGAAGALFALAVLHWTNGIDYPLDVGGRPLLSLPSYIPIAFETTVLFASLAAFVSVLVFSGLPRLHHPVFDLDGFERTTIDRFWITVGDVRRFAHDVAPEELRRLSAELTRLGAVRVHGDGVTAEGS